MPKKIISIVIIVLCVGLVGCTDPTEPIYTDGIYTVVNYGKVLVDDDYLSQGHKVLQELEIENFKVNKIFINTLGELTVTRIGDNNYIFEFVEIEEEDFPIQYVYIDNIKTSKDTLKGRVMFGGPLVLCQYQWIL